jgi:hypothetical protein
MTLRGARPLNQNQLEFVWQDKIIRKIPEKDKNDGSYEMFPEKFKKF